MAFQHEAERFQVTDAPAAAAVDLTFDYGAAAELFSPRGGKIRQRPLGYRRFTEAADAIRFAVEELPPGLLVGAYLQVGEERYGREGIRRLYDSVDYPFTRRALASG